MLKLRFPLPVFRNSKEIVSGKNSRMALKGIVANKVALIISSSIKNSSHYDQLIRLINSESILVIEKSWAGEPDIKNLAPTISELEIYKPDYIIALGGGSVIDGAKLAWMFYEHPSVDQNDLYKPFSLPPLGSKSKFASIPTTIGSGSEVSSAAVMIDPESMSKKAVVTHDFLSELVILDPDLVSDVSINILKLSIADALSHAVEGYVSKVHHPIMDSFAEKALSIIHKNSQFFNDTKFSTEMITDLQNASMLAGIVQNHCVVGMSHAIAHQLAVHNIGHALANGVLMPHVIDFNMQDEATKLKYSNLCKNSGMQNIDQIKTLFKILVENQEPSVSIKNREIKKICTNALDDPAARTNPVSFYEDDVNKIMKYIL